MTYEQMAALQRQSYKFKVSYAESMVHQFYRESTSTYVDEKNRVIGDIDAAIAWEDKTGKQSYKLSTHISVGGLDSLTLLAFIRHCGYDSDLVPAVSVSVLEDKGNQEVQKMYGVQAINPYKSKVQVLRELGFPVISKAKAKKLGILQTPDSEKQTFIHAIMTGDMGAQGGYKHSDKIKLPDKWLKLFAGHYNEHRPDLECKVAPFKVSSDCCYWMKEKPCDDWAREHHSVPYLGLMASEGGQRELGLVKNGCIYFGKTTIRCCPFNIFTRQDLLRLALDLNVPVPRAYGEIVEDENGLLRTTRAQRTGCSMCGFGIHIEKRPHRFDRLWEDNPKEWEFWMKNCCTDPETGEKYGWNRVLDWIGIGWCDPEMYVKNKKEIAPEA